MRIEDISKIITSFKDRRNIDKYCNVAPLKEIAENDYNLNIPRYVDTFEEEETVNLKSVSNELKNLEKEIIKTDVTIAGVCKELGIDIPFYMSESGF